MAEIEDYGALLEHYAEVDWVVFGKWNRLHKAVQCTGNEDEWCLENVVTACGRRKARAWIPGIFTRTGVQRCSFCCDVAGLPRDIGSPKNDKACRKLLGLEKV